MLAVKTTQGWFFSPGDVTVGQEVYIDGVYRGIVQKVETV